MEDPKNMSIAIAFLIAILAIFAAENSHANQASDFVVLNFTAEWCEPCKAMSGSLDQLSEQGWLIRQINVDKEKDLVKRWKVTELPTLIVLKDSREIDRMTGLLSHQDLQVRLPKVTASKSAPRLVSSLNAQIPPTSPAVIGKVVDPMSATVRIKIDDGQSTSFGSGTIIDQHGDEALVLTCGHLFRDLRPNSNLSVDVPIDGRLVTLAATVVDFQCNETDIGLIAFRPGRPIAVASLLPRGVKLKEQESVSSFGCDHGADPTRRDSHITKLNRYIGASNVEVAKAPVQGRSGGGLFNAKGELIGVCYAADGELDEGLYSGPEVVYNQLARLGLGRLYEPADQQVASISSSLPPGSSSVAQANTVSNAFPDRAAGDGWKSTVDQLARSARETAANTVASMTRANNGATLTAILRDAQGREQRITIPSPSPALLQTLQAHSQSTPASPVAVR